MINLIQHTSIIAATLISVAVFGFLFAVSWFLEKRTKLNVGLFFNFYILLLSVFIWLSLVYPAAFTGNYGRHLFMEWYFSIILFLSVWYSIKALSTLFWDMYLAGHREVHVPALLRNLVTVLVLITTVLLIIRFVFLHSLSGLLVASSVTAAVIAFALQDFLGGLIAGIALSIQPPFEVGDWIQVLDKEGKVVDINWRATTLETRDKTYLVVPNNNITNEKIVNFYQPTKLHDLEFCVGIEYGAHPTKVKDALVACAMETTGVRRMPKPQCRLVEFGDFAIKYEIQCCIDDHALKSKVKDEVLGRIWYSLNRKGIQIPLPAQNVYIHDSLKTQTNIEEKRQRKETYLRRADIFEALDDDNIQTLMQTSSHWFYGRGERIVKQADEGSSLFLILEGSVDVYVKMPDEGNEVNVGQLGAGDFFGEKSLLTGEPRSANVKAQSDVEVTEIEKQDLAPILKQKPVIMEHLSERLAERQLINEDFFEKVRKEQDIEEARANYSEKFLRGIQSFFGL